MCKLIAFDLDGTILDDSGELSKATMNYLEELLEKDYLLVPCSARTLFEYPTWFKDHQAIKYLITHNGAIIIDNETKEPLTNHTLSGKKSVEVAEILAPVNNLITFNYGEYMISSLDLYNFLLPQNTPFKSGMFAHQARAYAYDYKYFLNLNDGITKIHVSLPDPNDKEELYYLLKDVKDIYLQSSHPNNIEVTHPLANKGSALKFVLDQLNISSQEVISFGDNDNDVSLLEVAGHKVAMLNATPRLKAVADSLTKFDNNHDGVIDYLKSYLK